MVFEILPDQLDYETERGKPLPSKLHALLTQRLTIYLMVNYPGLFEVLPELTLNTPGEKTVPDISICEKTPINFFQDSIKQDEPPFATIEILSPKQSLQTLLDKTTDYFSFGVKSCWVVLPALKSIYLFSAPQKFEVFTVGDELFDPNLNIKVSMNVIFEEGK